MPEYKTYQTFEDYMADQPVDRQEIIAALRLFVGRVAPGLIESSKWGQGCWLSDGVPAIYVHVEPDYVQLGFYAGTSLNDPTHILKGNAKFVRHVKVYSLKDIDKQAIAPLIKQAIAHGKA